MEWTESIRKVIDYMEAHLLEDISADAAANEVFISSFYMQKGFKILTGYTVGEYIRNRRLYLAALDVLSDREKVIDIAYKYGYDTPESFTKAFKRFHGVSPAQLQKSPSHINTFLPLRIVVSIKGGNDMDYSIEKMEGFKAIGFSREFAYENAYEKVPKFWDKIFSTYVNEIMKKGEPQTPVEKAIVENKIGTYGINIGDSSLKDKFRYLIAGPYQGGEIPREMVVIEVPAAEWVKFQCVGPMPGALQSANSKIFQEWLPGNTEFEIASDTFIEWYSPEGDTRDASYESAIWVPVKRK